MDTVEATRITDISGVFTPKAMLAAATLCIRFFMAYLAAIVWFYMLTPGTFFACIYAQKRLVNRITHDRKFALFPGYAK